MIGLGFVFCTHSRATVEGYPRNLIMERSGFVSGLSKCDLVECLLEIRI